VWVGIVWACILIFVWLRGKIHIGEWRCKVVGTCEVQLICKVRCSGSSQRDRHLCVCVCVSLPEVPSLWDTACVCVDLPRDNENIHRQLVDAVRDYGRVLSHAPVQITDVSERPAALLVHWAEVQIASKYYFYFDDNSGKLCIVSV